MTEKYGDENERVRAIIEAAIDQLKAVGADDGAALSLLAFQALVRLGNPAIPWAQQLAIIDSLQGEIDRIRSVIEERYADDNTTRH
jgi:hypothetical protein